LKRGGFMKKPLIIIIIVVALAVAVNFYVSSNRIVPSGPSVLKEPLRDENGKLAAPPAPAAAPSTSEAAVLAPKEQLPAVAKPPKPDKPVVNKVEIKNAKRAIVKGSGVNVRSESHIAADNSLGKFNKGEQFEIIGAEQPAGDNHKWIKVKLKNGKTGFVREDLVELQ